MHPTTESNCKTKKLSCRLFILSGPSSFLNLANHILFNAAGMF
jgi:hypothetical protein